MTASNNSWSRAKKDGKVITETVAGGDVGQIEGFEQGVKGGKTAVR